MPFRTTLKLMVMIPAISMAPQNEISPSPSVLRKIFELPAESGCKVDSEIAYERNAGRQR